MSDQGHMGGDGLFREAIGLMRESAAAADPELAARELASLKSLHAAALEKVDALEKRQDELLHVLHQARLYSARVLVKLKSAVEIGLAHVDGHGRAAAMATEIEKAGDAADRIAKMAEAGHCACAEGHCQYAAPAPGPMRRMALLVKRSAKAPHLGLVQDSAEQAIRDVLPEVSKP